MAVFFFISALICSSVGLMLLILDVLKSQKAIGIIIGNDLHDGEVDRMYAPKIRFRTCDGIDREFQSALYVHSDPIKFGIETPVRYHPSVSWLNGIDRWYCRWLPPLLFLSCGVVFGMAWWLS